MPSTAAAILDQFRHSYGKDIDLTLRPAYRELLARLGNPHHKLPPVIHVAGTNGKGSTCAFLRAMIEAAGGTAHVYTSPHLVALHERIRIAGTLITEDELRDILLTCQKLAQPGGVSFFEAITAAAFVAFARHPADFVIIEVGLGGRLDATNIIEAKAATIITRLSYDHRDYLGDTLAQIAREKAGIMRPGAPCFIAAQPDPAALAVLQESAEQTDTTLFIENIDWSIIEETDGFTFSTTISLCPAGTLPPLAGGGRGWGRTAGDNLAYRLPAPALTGHHQYHNAGLAIATLTSLNPAFPIAAITRGLQTVQWPGRLQHLPHPTHEIWLDGGHNDSAGEVLAAQITQWRVEDGDTPRPLSVILGMLTTKNPAEFLSPFAQAVTRLRTVAIDHEPLSFTADALAAEARKAGITDAAPAASVTAALADLTAQNKTTRLLICGSLYLAGLVLAARSRNPINCLG